MFLETVNHSKLIIIPISRDDINFLILGRLLRSSVCEIQTSKIIFEETGRINQPIFHCLKIRELINQF